MTAAFVQEVVAGGTAVNSATLVLTISGVTTQVGRHLILCAASRGSSSVSIVDSRGNTWAVDKQQSGTGGFVAIASTKIATALVNGDTITLTYNTLSGQAASVAEYSGLAAASWFDVAAAAVGLTGTASDSGATATTAQAAELLIGATMIQSSFSAFAAEVVSPIWNLNTAGVSVGTVDTIRPMYRVVAATGTYSATATWTTSRVWAAAIATYKAAPPAGRSQVVMA